MVTTCCNVAMETAEIRRKILAEIVARDGLSSVAKRVGKPDSQINDMLNGRKSFGEKVARAIEKRYAPDLPSGKSIIYGLSAAGMR